MNKTFKVVMLPTEKAEDCILKQNLHLEYQKGYFTQEYLKTSNRYSQHLYILSDDKIKEGDWVIEYQKGDEQGTVQQIKNEYVLAPDIQKKIVATTDRSIRRDSSVVSVNNPRHVFKVGHIPESFIQSYIKAYNEDKPITEVDLEMEDYLTEELAIKGSFTNYRIKTRHNNTVIVHQSKMYARDEVIKLCQQAYTFGLMDQDDPIDIDEWIQNNL